MLLIEISNEWYSCPASAQDFYTKLLGSFWARLGWFPQAGQYSTEYSSSLPRSPEISLAACPLHLLSLKFCPLCSLLTLRSIFSTQGVSRLCMGPSSLCHTWKLSQGSKMGQSHDFPICFLSLKEHCALLPDETSFFPSYSIFFLAV